MIELLRVRLHLINGTTRIKTLRQKTVRLFRSADEAEDYRRGLKARFEAKHPGDTVEVMMDTRSKEGVILK